MNVEYAEIRDAILIEHNKIREDPQSYIPHLEKYLTYFKESILAKPGDNHIQTHEGKNAFLEAIDFLKNQKPVAALTIDSNLNRSAEEHIADIGPKGIVSHESTEGKNVSDRIEAHCEWDGACAENLDFGTKDPISIIINLLVDDGVSSRCHRKNLFNEAFKFVGIALGPHKDFQYVTVIDYVGGVRPLGTPFFDYKNFKFDYKLLEEAQRKPKTAFQLEDRDAPDETVSVKIMKSGKLHNGRFHRITKKFYTLKDGSVHIVEVEDV